MQGVRNLNVGLALGRRDGTDPWDVAPICRVGLRGVAEGVVVSIPLTPADMLVDQERALTRMMRACALVGDVDAVGLGRLCAVVAGRGEALAERVSVPVTTGGAATAWALWRNTQAVVARVGGPIAVIGSTNAVGNAVAALLADEGHEVRVDHPRGARGGVIACAGPDEAARGAAVVVGAGPTGASLDPGALRPGAVVVDVALPGTVRGRVPRGVRVIAGEAVSLPAAWTRDGWGLIYHLLAGYGPTQVYACLVEPLVLATTHRGAPFALGRRVAPAVVQEFGAAAEALGFRPRLAVGWRAFPVDRLAPPRVLMG